MVGLVIVITKQNDVYKATLKNYPEVWETGNTPTIAVGKLIISNSETCNVRVEHRYKRRLSK